jgi:hypothetical protein
MLPQPLIEGQGVHLGLDFGYRDSINQFQMAYDSDKAVSSFLTWAQKRAAQVERLTGPMWETERGHYAEIVNRGSSLLQHYGLWVGSRYQSLDKGFKLLGTERKFVLPVPGTSRISYSGRFDGLVQERSTGKIYVLEFKTTARLTYMPGVFRGLQPTAYIWAARQIYNLPVVGMLYRVLWKRIPDNPKLLQNGGFSRAKGQKMTLEWAEYYLDQLARAQRIPETGEVIHRPLADPEVQVRRKKFYMAAQGLRQMLKERGNNFFLQRKIPRNDIQIGHFLSLLRDEGLAMIKPRQPIYPKTGVQCTWCHYKDPCDLLSLGHVEAAEDLLDAEYAPRGYWDEAEAETDEGTA